MLNKKWYHFSLGWKLTMFVGLVLLCVAGLYSIAIPGQAGDKLYAAEIRRAQGISLLLANTVKTPFDLYELQGTSDLKKALDLVNDVPGAQYAAVLDAGGAIIADWRSPGIDAVPQKKFKWDAAAQHAIISAAKRELAVRFDTVSTADGLHTQILFMTESNTMGRVQIGFSMMAMQRDQAALRSTIITISAVTFLLSLLALWFYINRQVVHPINVLKEVTTKIVASGDLTKAIELHTKDELGELAYSFNNMVDHQRSLIKSFQILGLTLGEAIEQLSAVGSSVSEGAYSIHDQVQNMAEAMQDMLDSLLDIDCNIKKLIESAEASSATVGEMAQINEQTAKNILSMAATVEASTTTIDEMVVSFQEIDQNIKQLDVVINETSSSMSQLESSIVLVEGNASHSADLTHTVTDHADKGVASLHKTLHGIELIRTAFGTASDTINTLVSRISEVDTILNVIDEITAQTNLLSLNAAIIASQAGEHGRGFGVVAEEIRALASRTKNSTSEIAENINHIQTDSANAIKAMSEGMKSVDAGIALGQEAAKALQQIHSSSQKSSDMVNTIARATIEQASGTKALAASSQLIAETVNHISNSSSEQAHKSGLILESTAQITMLNQQAHSSSLELASGSKQVISANETIFSMVEQVGKNSADNAESSRNVLKTVDAIKKITKDQSESVERLEAVIEALVLYSGQLHKHVEGFTA